MPIDATQYLEALSASLAGSTSSDGNNTEDALKKIQEFYSKRLWHEFSTALLELMFNDSRVRQASYDIHEHVLQGVHQQLNPAVYVKMLYLSVVEGGADVSLSSDSSDNKDPSISLLDGAIAALMQQENGSQFAEAVRCVKALLLMKGDSASPEALRLLSGAEDCISATPCQDLHVVLQALYFRARAREYELTHNYETFYDAVFHLSVYGESSGLPIRGDELSSVAYKAAMAALLAPRIHNFGKLLTFKPFADTLEASCSPNHKKILDLCKLCNAGDVDGYTKFIADNKASLIDTIPDLSQATKTSLPTKVRLMALLHLCFHTPSDQRTYTLTQISNRCSVPEDEVEPLLLQAFALKLIKGKIDGLKGIVEVTWVQSRVLSLDEVAALADRIARWRKIVAETASSVADAAKDIPS